MTGIDWIKGYVKECIIENPDKAPMYQQIYEDMCPEDRAQIASILYTGFERKDAVFVVSHILYYTSIEYFQKIALDLLLMFDHDCFLGATFDCVMSHYGIHYYSEKRALRAKNKFYLSKLLQTEYPYLPYKDCNRNRVVLVVPQLLSSLHAPTNVALNFLYTFTELEVEYLLFSCPSDYEIPHDIWHTSWTENSIELCKTHIINYSFRDKVFHGYQICTSEQKVKEYDMMLRMIHLFNPMCVIDMGARLPITDLCIDFTRVVAFPLSIQCPVSGANLLLRLGRTDATLEEEYLQALESHQKQVFLERAIPVVFKEDESNVTRTDLGIREDSFLIALVGNRLAQEIDSAFIQILMRILQTQPSIEIVIIGDSAELEGMFSDTIFMDRIHFAGYQENLMAAYKLVDLYVNPFRKGGGFSSKIALFAQVPVVTLPDCDVAYNAGPDFVVSHDAYADTIIRYASDPDYYSQMKRLTEKFDIREQQEEMKEFVQYVLETAEKIFAADN